MLCRQAKSCWPSGWRGWGPIGRSLVGLSPLQVLDQVKQAHGSLPKFPVEEVTKGSKGKSLSSRFDGVRTTQHGGSKIVRAVSLCSSVAHGYANGPQSYL